MAWLIEFDDLGETDVPNGPTLLRVDVTDPEDDTVCYSYCTGIPVTATEEQREAFKKVLAEQISIAEQHGYNVRRTVERSTWWTLDDLERFSRPPVEAC